MSSSLSHARVRADAPPLRSTLTASNPDFGGDALDDLVAPALAEMAESWREGHGAPAEKWLDARPELAAVPQLAVRIVFEELCLRQEHGQEIDTSEVYARFPQWKHALEVVLDCHALMQTEPAGAAYPEVGGQIGELQLLRELGRGGQGRVFLATQPSLSDRPLAVKLTRLCGDEHLSLARLQHTHIVPLYLVQEFPAENLRALCMPYLGGTSWSHVLQTLRAKSLNQRQGRDLVAALEAQRDDVYLPRSAGPALAFLARASYIEAVAWVGACLADALNDAHERGLVHLDIKPSNVLLAADGQPMLLDFHLAREVVAAGCNRVERLGGTRGYMSREQEACADAVRARQAMPTALDGRSDIYSLGVTLYESLTGRLPPDDDEPMARLTLRRANSQISRGLEDIVLKSLMRDPAARYATAGELATDLRRHLAGLPLRGVPNRSLTERWRKWRRRKPHAMLVLGAGCAALAVVATTVLWFHEDRASTARQALNQARGQFVGRDFAAAAERAEAGLASIRFLPGQTELRRTLKAEENLARRAQIADRLHALVDRLRFVDGMQNAPVAQLKQLEAGCQRIWEARDKMAALDATADAGSQTQLHRDLLDLAVLWTRLRIALADREHLAAERRAALTVLDEAEALRGSSSILELARLEYRAAPAGDQAVDEWQLPPRNTAWEHFATGRFWLQAQRLKNAREEFEQAIRLEPNAFWPNFYLTLCTYRQEEFEQALHWAYVCVALAPTSAECYFNRALCQQAAGHSAAALADFNRASELDPNSGLIILHRGLLQLELRDYSKALADLRGALEHQADPATVHYQMALVFLAMDDLPAARESLERALAHNPADPSVVSLKNRLAAER